MHHLIIVDIDVDGAKRVADPLYLGGVVRHGHVFLLDVIQLLAELKLACGCVRGENLLEIFPRLFGRRRVSYVAKHVVVYTCCQAIHYVACGLQLAACSLRLAPMSRIGEPSRWVGLCALIRCSSNSLLRQGIGASCTPKIALPV